MPNPFENVFSSNPTVSSQDASQSDTNPFGDLFKKTDVSQAVANTPAPDVAAQRAEKIAAGEPVSVNPNRVNPTLVGGLLRGLAGGAVRTVSSVLAPFTPEQSWTTDSQYLGKVSDIATEVRKNSEMLADQVKSGKISLGRAIAASVAHSALNTADVAFTE